MAFGSGHRQCNGCCGRTGTKVESAANIGHSDHQLHGISYVDWRRWQLSSRSLCNERHHARQQSASKFTFQVWYISARIRYRRNQCRHNLTPRTLNLLLQYLPQHITSKPSQFVSLTAEIKSHLDVKSWVHRTVPDRTHNVTRRRNYCANDVVRRTWTARRHLRFTRFRSQQTTELRLPTARTLRPYESLSWQWRLMVFSVR
jgi:hypothetical protein